MPTTIDKDLKTKVITTRGEIKGKKTIAIIGGGAAAIMCGCFVDSDIYDVHLYEKTSRLGRKLLVAGEGGFNLSYHEEMAIFKTRYRPSGFLDDALDQFSNEDLVTWLQSLGIESYVGTSNRIFPVKGIKPYMVVDKMMDRLTSNGVTVHTNVTWKGWSDDSIVLEMNGKEESRKYDHVIYALGGGSYRKTGSDGNWIEIFKRQGITCKQLEASNCAWKIDWEEDFINIAEGKPLKNIVLRVGDEKVKGELLISKTGLEGGAIYAQAHKVRSEIKQSGSANLYIDFKPSLRIEEVTEKLQRRTKSIKYCLEKDIKLAPVVCHLLRTSIPKEEYQSASELANHIKNFKLTTKAGESIDKAISTVGGVILEEVNQHLTLKKIPNSFVIGEMLDWDTRTGGYLLQASFSMGVYVARYLNNKNN